MTSRRQERIAEVLTEELGLLIASELTDPRLEDAMVTVTDVQVSPDLGNARVYVQHALPPAQSRHVLSALQHSTTFLRRSLLENLKLRVVPELHFVIDEMSERAQRIDEILDRIAAEQATPTPPPNGAGDGDAPRAQNETEQDAREPENHADAE